MSTPTDARTIALEFCKQAFDKPTKSQIARTVIQAKQILSEGYSVDDTLLTLDYALNVKRVNMYSLGYLKVTMGDLLPQAVAHRDKEKAKKEQQALIEAQRNAEEVNDAERNRTKARGYGVQSGFGKKHSFDMLEE